MSRLNIGLGAGTGRLQQRWGGRFSSVVPLAATAFHPLPGQGCSSGTSPDSPAASLGIPAHPCLGEFLAGPHCVCRRHPSRREPPSSRVGQDMAATWTHDVAAASAALHQGNGGSLVLPLTKATAGASTSLKPSSLWAKAHNTSSSSPFASCPALAPRWRSLGPQSHGYLRERYLRLVYFPLASPEMLFFCLALVRAFAASFIFNRHLSPGALSTRAPPATAGPE